MDKAQNNNGLRGIKFSSDQHGLREGQADSPAESITKSIVSLDDARHYLSEIHVEFQEDPSYKLIDGYRRKIDNHFGPKERLGEAFIDGAVIELNVIYRFAPYLAPGLYKSINEDIARIDYEDLIRKRERIYYGRPEPVDDTTSNRQGKYSGELKLPYDELKLLQLIDAAQYTNELQYDALREGFMYVRTHAERANYQDYYVMSKQAFGQTALTTYQLDHELRDLLRDEGKAGDDK